MKKIVIGIVSRPIESISKRNMLGVYETYLRSVIKVDAIPLIISPVQDMDYQYFNESVELKEEEKDNLNKVLKLCDGIILPGGDSPFKYDYYILEYAIKNDIPILGICLGMQVMASFKNNNIIPVDNHYMIDHKITINKESILYKIFKTDNLLVNSRHKEKANSSGIYKVVAKSLDGIIEAIELDYNTFNIGVEWHPEDLENNEILFKYMVDIIRKQKK